MINITSKQRAEEIQNIIQGLEEEASEYIAGLSYVNAENLDAVQRTFSSVELFLQEGEPYRLQEGLKESLDRLKEASIQKLDCSDQFPRIKELISPFTRIDEDSLTRTCSFLSLEALRSMRVASVSCNRSGDLEKILRLSQRVSVKELELTKDTLLNLLERLKGEVHSLDISGLKLGSIRGENLKEVLNYCPNLTSLTADGCNLQNADMEVLANYAICKLSIKSNNIGDRGALVLSEIKTLTNLDLGGNYVNSAGVVALSAMTQLEHLGLASNGARDKEFASLGNLHNLSFLDLSYARLGLKGIAAIESLENLRVFVFNKHYTLPEVQNFIQRMQHKGIVVNLYKPEKE